MPQPTLTRTVPHIPLEVSEQIAQHLDLKSAQNLSRVCKSLRDAGEIKCWEAVDITSGWNVPLPAENIESYRARACTVDTRLQRAIDAIAVYPLRGESIRSIRIEPSDGVGGHRARALIDFIKPLTSRLTDLACLPLIVNTSTWSDAVTSELACYEFYAKVDSTLITFPKVNNIQYRRGNREVGSLPAWLLRILTLKQLEISIDEVSFSDTAEYLADHPVPGALRALGYVHLNNADAQHRQNPKILRTLLSLAPNICLFVASGRWKLESESGEVSSLRKRRVKTTMVMDLNRRWEDQEEFEEEEDEDEAVDENIKHKGELATVPNTAPNSIALGQEDGNVESEEDDTWGEGGYSEYDEYDGVEDELAHDYGLGPGIMPTCLEEGMMEVDVWDTGIEIELQRIELPSDPTLERLAIVTIPPLATLESPCDPIHDARSATGRIPSTFIRQLRRTPKLTDYYTPYTEAAFPSNFAPRGAIEPPTYGIFQRWSKSGHRGAFIRQYTKPGTTHDTGDEFWHIRVLSASKSADQREWRDLARYKGKTVPRDILEAVYKTAPLDMNFESGGRNMPLGRAGWRETNPAWGVLYDWRKDAGAKSDQEDTLSNGSDEDDYVFWKE